MIERRYLLLYAYKAFIYASIAAVIYIFTAGLFTSTTTEGLIEKNTPHSFSLLPLNDHSHIYLNINGRELLVIRDNDAYSAFWANDPIYGCKLELKEAVIKPVCIDIEYNLEGFSESINQTLNQPVYEIYKGNIIIKN